MKPEEQKKLVAEKLMGWEVSDSTMIIKPHIVDRILYLDYWNPQDNDKATCKEWYEIFEKMDSEKKFRYIFELASILGLYKTRNSELFTLQSAKPSIRWEALIKTLEAL